MPHLVAAQKTPFLRIKKPQPLKLAMILKYKILRKAGWYRRDDQLVEQLKQAELEKRWDRMMEGLQLAENKTKKSHFHNARHAGATEGSWRLAIEESITWLRARKWRGDQETIAMSKRMTEIVWKEQELAAKEEAERRKKKNRERRQRRRERWKEEKEKQREQIKSEQEAQNGQGQVSETDLDRM